MGLDRCVLSSLTGLILCSRHNPAINRWAIFERPCGTWNRDTLNACKARGYPHAVAPRLLHRFDDFRQPEPLPAGGPHRCRICRRRHRTRRASTRRTPPATFLPGLCHRWPRGWPQTPVRTTPHLVGRGEATVEIEDDRFGHWPLAVGVRGLVA